MNTFVTSDYTRKPPRLQRGLVVVELAITLPLVLLVMLATAEFGRAIYQYTTLTKAVRDGARYYASTANDGSIALSTKVLTTEHLIVNGNPQGTGNSILPSFSDSNVTEISAIGPVGSVPADHVRVTATYAYAPMIGKLPIYGAVAGFTMTSSVTMRAL